MNKRAALLAQREQQIRENFARQVVEEALGELDSEEAMALFQAFLKVPREQFVHEADIRRAWDAFCASIRGRFGERMLAPSCLARMISLLPKRPQNRVLLIAAGSGYAAAILAELGAQVFAFDTDAGRGRQARLLLDGLGYQSVIFRCVQSAKMWAEYAPFDAAISLVVDGQVLSGIAELLVPEQGVAIGLQAQENDSSGGQARLILMSKEQNGQIQAVPLESYEVNR